jgi:hypothetical protein
MADFRFYQEPGGSNVLAVYLPTEQEALRQTEKVEGYAALYDYPNTLSPMRASTLTPWRAALRSPKRERGRSTRRSSNAWMTIAHKGSQVGKRYLANCLSHRKANP